MPQTVIANEANPSPWIRRHVGDAVIPTKLAIKPIENMSPASSGSTINLVVIVMGVVRLILGGDIL
jgi:hypothetical protein